MALLSDADRATVRESLAAIVSPVRLLFFTQTLDCETCDITRQILDEVVALHDQIALEEVNFVLDRDKVAQYAVDRVPAIVVAGASDTGIRFYGAPAGYEFVSLVEAIAMVGTGNSGLSPASKAMIAAVTEPVTIQVFTTPTWPHCPRAVSLAHQMAFESPHITAIAVEATEFPDLARRYRVSGVPKTVVNDRTEILGGLPEEMYVPQVLEGLA